MKIDITLIENAINIVVKDILQELNGELSITNYEAIGRLGAISSFVINLRDEAKEQGYQDDVLERIWELKREADNNLQKLFEEISYDG